MWVDHQGRSKKNLVLLFYMLKEMMPSLKKKKEDDDTGYNNNTLVNHMYISFNMSYDYCQKPGQKH